MEELKEKLRKILYGYDCEYEPHLQAVVRLIIKFIEENFVSKDKYGQDCATHYCNGRDAQKALEEEIADYKTKDLKQANTDLKQASTKLAQEVIELKKQLEQERNKLGFIIGIILMAIIIYIAIPPTEIKN